MELVLQMPTIAMRLQKILWVEMVLQNVDGISVHYHLEILIPAVCQHLRIVLELHLPAGAH
jgi:hypothetical protein